MLYGCFACIYVCVPFECSSHRGQKRVSDLLEMELQMVVKCHVGVVNLT